MSSIRTASLCSAGALALGALALAACSKPAAPAAGSASAAAPASSAAASVTPGPDVEIHEGDLPHPRAGAWTMVNTDDPSDQPTRLCVVDRPLNLGKLRQLCQKFSFHRTWSGGIVVDSECAKGEVSTKTHMTVTGDFQNDYKSDMQLTMNLGHGQPARTTEMHMENRYVGACTPEEQAEAERTAHEMDSQPNG